MVANVKGKKKERVGAFSGGLFFVFCNNYNYNLLIAIKSD